MLLLNRAVDGDGVSISEFDEAGEYVKMAHYLYELELMVGRLNAPMHTSVGGMAGLGNEM